MLIFGRELSRPVDVIFGLPPDQQMSTVDYVTNLRKDMEKAYEEVRLQLEVEQRRQKDYYDRLHTLRNSRLVIKVGILYLP